jgi:oligoendopeptidase F
MSIFSASIKKYQYAFTLALLCISYASSAQQSDPFDGKAAAFHIKLTRYFKSEQDEKASRLLILDSARIFKQDTAWTIENLRTHLDRYETLLVALERHYYYYNIRNYINNKDSVSRQIYNLLDDSIGSLQGMAGRILLKPLFTAITPAELSKYNLLKYQYLLMQARQEATHELPDKEEQLLSKLADPTLDHLIDRYDVLMDSIKAAPIQASAKDSDVRRNSVNAYYKAYNDHAEVLAATLIDITLQKIALAKIRGFNSAPERAYMRRLELPEASVKSLLTEMTQRAGVLKDYQQLQAEQIKHISGLKQVHSWDTSLPMGFAVPPMPYKQAQTTILAALAPLGKAYQDKFAYLLNPANGELDIAPGPDRVTEFTSIGFPGVPESLYMKSYTGSLRDVSRLIHEGGHAIHEQFMSDNLAVPSYKQGPSFVYEAYAMFNELLLLDELEKNEKNLQGKAFYTKQFLDKLSFEVFTSAEEGTFEQGLYDGVAAGRINTQGDIDSLYAGIMNKYDIYFAGEPQRRSEWINKRLVFDDPLYNVNYLYAILVSCKLYAMVHQDPIGFATKYTALLKNGFDMPAGDLFKKFMGFNLDNEALLNSTLQLMQNKTALLKNLYHQINATVVTTPVGVVQK